MGMILSRGGGMHGSLYSALCAFVSLSLLGCSAAISGARIKAKPTPVSSVAKNGESTTSTAEKVSVMTANSGEKGGVTAAGSNEKGESVTANSSQSQCTPTRTEASTRLVATSQPTLVWDNRYRPSSLVIPDFVIRGFKTESETCILIPHYELGMMCGCFLQRSLTPEQCRIRTVC
jgi:hypothetical protein